MRSQIVLLLNEVRLLCFLFTCGSGISDNLFLVNFHNIDRDPVAFKSACFWRIDFSIGANMC